jgi:hypothetical protein
LLLSALALGPAVSRASATAAVPVVPVQPDVFASAPPLMGLGVELDPYDAFQPTAAEWNLVFQRLDFMRPGFVRVVEPASDYFGGYDSAHDPVYRWTAPHVLQLRTILDYAKSRGITVVLGDWANPVINGDTRIPAGFVQQLHDVYGYTNIRYYNLMNEPNYSSCDFPCWTNLVSSLSTEFSSLGMNAWLQLVGPDNANSWGDTQQAQTLDRSSGLDNDNPIGGDSWLTSTLDAIPSLIGAYDSHRYATMWGLENGVYGDQMRARREQISNVDSPAKAYFEGEAGLVARQVNPFAAGDRVRPSLSLAPMVDPSARPRASSFVDSQPHINEFGYGVWMADMMIQALGAGLSGASAWDLDDAMHVGGQYGSRNLKQWGFWNSLGGQAGYPASDLELRPWYYTWSLLARSFPPGSQALLVPSSGVPGVRMLAARVPTAGGYRFSFAMVNDSDTPRSVALSMPSAPSPLTLTRYDYFAGDRPADANGFPVPSATLRSVRLDNGLRVAMPSRGLVVLNTPDAIAPPRLSLGTSAIVDGLTSWGEVYAHSTGLTLDRSNPAQFNQDISRAVPAASATAPQYLVYRASQIAGFELKAYYAQRPSLAVYLSQDGRTWTPLALAATNPAPAVGGQRYLEEIVPGEPIPAGINWLKIQLAGTDTELGEVDIQAGRVGPACLARNVQAKRRALAGIALGASKGTVRYQFGVPTRARTRVWQYCVNGGGEVVVVFARGRAALIASSARSYRPGGIAPGTAVGRLRRGYRGRALRALGGGVFVGTTRKGAVVFIARGGRVQAAAVVSRALLKNQRALSRVARLARPLTTTTGAAAKQT